MAQQEEKGKLFVGGLSWETTQASLLAYFCKFGEVKDCVVITNPQTGKSRGFGFVTFKDPACVETVQAAGPHILDGKQIDPNGCNRKKTGKSGKSAENSKRKLFVGGLPSNIDEAQLREGFSSYGKINEVVIVYDQQKQKPRGFGFLTFENEESVDKIVKERFVLLNGKQVECKRAEAKEPQSHQEQATGLMMIAQAPDGTIGLVPATAATSGVVYQSPGGLVTPAELAGAYKGLLPTEGMQPTLPGLKFLTQQGATPQYVLLGGGGASGAGYLVQGTPAGHGTGGLLMQGSGFTQTNQLGGLMMAGAGAQTPGMIVASPTGGGYIVHGASAGAGTGGYILSGGAGGAGILLQGNPGPGLQGGQYLMQYPTGAVVQAPHAVDIGASLSGLGSTISGVQLPQTIYSLAKTEAQTGDPEKSSVVGASYSVLNQYAALGLMGGTSNDSTNEEAGGRGSSSNETATSSSSVQTTPKLGYYIVPSYQAASQLSGYAAQYGSPIFGSADPNQPTIIAAAPSLTPYGRLASNHAALTHGYHPYRR